MNKEGQQFNPNPEWETNKEQNIAIAKRIDDLLLKGPGLVDTCQRVLRRKIENLEEEQMPDEINALEKGGFTKESMPESIKGRLAIEELTNGYTASLRHVDDKSKTIWLGIAYHERAIEESNEDIDLWGFGELLPKGINFPAHLIVRGTPSLDDKSPEFHSSSAYGDLPYQFIGADGLLYVVRNVFWFTTYGQGLKIEEIMRFKWDDEDEREEAEKKLPKVNLIPQPEHSRVVPLTAEDYVRINKMLEDIDSGLYKTPQV